MKFITNERSVFPETVAVWFLWDLTTRQPLGEHPNTLRTGCRRVTLAWEACKTSLAVSLAHPIRLPCPHSGPTSVPNMI